jgi:hypothetical protein
MRQFDRQQGRRVNLDAEPIDPELRACIEEVLGVQPSAR